jgi:hypothetical protein
MINIFNRLIFDVKYFNSWKKDDFFWFPVSALRFQVSSLATSHFSIILLSMILPCSLHQPPFTFHLSPVTIVTP